MKMTEKTQDHSDVMLPVNGSEKMFSADDVQLSGFCQLYQYRCLSQFAMLYQCCHVSCSPISVFICLGAHCPRARLNSNN